MGKWKWTTARAYADHAGLDVQYVRKLIHLGIIPALVMKGGHFRIDIPMADEALEAYMRQPKPLPERPKKEFDQLGRTANKAVADAGGFTAALQSILEGAG